jgi:tetratricopeptide (TPR) repeat protein
VRAELHERFASWLEQHGGELVELDELLGYHLEQACLYRAELGMSRDEDLAAAATRRLVAGGRRASRRQDYRAAVSLLERAAALLPTTNYDLALEVELWDALFWIGRADEALRRADALAERSAAAGDRIGELYGRIHLALFRSDVEPETVAALVDEALAVFQNTGDDLGLYVAYSALWEKVPSRRAEAIAALEGDEGVFAHAGQAGLPSMSLGGRAAWRFFGVTSVPELLEWLDANEPPTGRDHFLRAYRAGSLAMLGRFDEARAILGESRAELGERGLGVLLANITAFESVWVELWAGDPAAAAEFGAEGWKMYEELGERIFLSAAAGNLAQALYALDRLDEADTWARRGEKLGLADEDENCRRVRAKVLARRGEHGEAERLASEAVTSCDQTDALNMQGDAYADLAEVLVLAGKPNDAAAALEQALQRYARKGNVVSLRRTRARLAKLQEAASL